MPTAGEQLRQSREKQKLSVEEISRRTNIKSDHIRALEDSNWKPFPAPVYIRGFVRSYGGFLGMDVPRLMAELDGELASHSEYSAPPPLDGHKRGVIDFVTLQLARINWKWAMWLAGLGLAVWAGVAGWRATQARSRRDPLQSIPRGIYRTPTTAKPQRSPVMPVPTNAPNPGRRP